MTDRPRFQPKHIFRSIVEQSAEAIAVVDSDGVIIYSNHAVSGMFGYSPAEMTGKKVEELAAADEKDFFRTEFERIYNSGSDTDMQFHFRNRLDADKHIECSIINRSDRGFLIFFYKDITREYTNNIKKRKIYNIFQEFGSDPDENIGVTVKKACEILDGDCSLYNKFDEKKNLLITATGYNLPEGYKACDKPDGHICFEAVVSSSEEIVAIPDLASTGFIDTDSNVGRYGLQAYIGCAVTVGTKRTGSLCVVYNDRRDFSAEDREILFTLSKALSLEEMRKTALRKLESSIEEKEYLMKEINHRVKNNLLMITSLIRLKENTDAKSDFSDLIHQIDAIRIVHEKLYSSGDIMHIEVGPYLSKLLETIFGSFGGGNVKLNIDIAEIRMNSKQLATLGLIVNEIATNSLKYAFDNCDEPEFNLKITRGGDGTCETSISNNGVLMPEKVNLEYPKTLGMRLIKALSGQLGGDVELVKFPRTEYRLSFTEE